MERELIQYQGNYGQGKNRKKIDEKLANNLLKEQLELLNNQNSSYNNNKNDLNNKNKTINNSNLSSENRRFGNEVFFNEKSNYREKNTNRTLIIRTNSNQDGKSETTVLTGDSDTPEGSFNIKKYNQKLTVKYKPFEDMWKNFGGNTEPFNFEFSN